MLYRIELNGVLFILKGRVAAGQGARILFSLQLQQMAAEQGFSPGLVPGTCGNLGCQLDGIIWSLSRFAVNTKARQLSASVDWFRKIGILLGSIHNTLAAAEGLVETSFLSWPVPSNDIINRKTTNWGACLPKEVVRDLRQSLASRKQYASLKRQWLHGDFSTGNIINKISSITGEMTPLLIDFDNASYFPRIYEVIRGFFAIGGVQRSCIRANFREYVRGYIESQSLTEIEKTFGLDAYCWIAAHDVVTHLRKRNGIATTYDQRVIRRIQRIRTLRPALFNILTAAS
nr:phosphotransferase [uncultured Roseateles sp.]